MFLDFYFYISQVTCFVLSSCFVFVVVLWEVWFGLGFFCVLFYFSFVLFFKWQEVIIFEFCLLLLRTVLETVWVFLFCCFFIESKMNILDFFPWHFTWLYNRVLFSLMKT